MAFTIMTEDVLRAMAPVLGVRFPHGVGLDETVAHLLRTHQPRHESREELLARLKDCIFGGIYNHLGRAMLLQMENGQVRRILLQDVEDLTDACYGVLLMALPAADAPLDMLRSLAMTEGSLAAMRALLCRYSYALPEMEKATLRRILVENGVPESDLP